MHEATPVLRLLEMFRENPVHMAVVVDEYGVLEGIVTPTDILIAIAGELPEDVADLEEAAAVRRDDGSWLMDGMLGIHEAERLLERKDMRGDEDFETLAGFVLARFGPHPADRRPFRLGRAALRDRRHGRPPHRPHPGDACSACRARSRRQ